MDKSGKNENRMLKIVSACDAFTAAYSVMSLLFFVPYIMSRGQWIAAAFVPICLVLPFALMPLLYTLVHRFAPLLFGRYHLFMPLSALLSALLFAVFWSADGSAMGAVRIVFSAAALSVTTVMYRYCSFSVRVRLCGDGIATPTKSYLVYAGVGAASAVVTVAAFYYYDFETAFINGAYIVAAIGVILAMVQYLTTFYQIPKLSGKRDQSVKSAFRTFYGRLNYRTFFSSIFTVAAFAIILALAFNVTVFYNLTATILPAVYGFAACGAAVGAFTIASFFTRFIKRRSKKLTIVIITLLMLSALLFALTEAFAAILVSNAWTVFAAVSAAALAGAGLALALRQMRIRFLTVKPHITSGVVHILTELAIVAAAAIALGAAVIIAAVARNDIIYYAYGFAAAAVLGIAAVIAARIRRTAPIAPKEPSFEPIAVTRDGDDNIN